MGPYIPRAAEGLLKDYLELTPILALVGARQVGKTTMIKQTLESERNVPYVTFDDPSVLMLFNESIQEFHRDLIEGHELVVMDEVQYGTDVGRKLKFLCDVKDAQLVITSSSETLLRRDVLSHLVGRLTLLKLHPFSTREYLTARGIKTESWEYVAGPIREQIYYGGYPRVVLENGIEKKQKLLTDIISLTVLKDVVHSFGLSDELKAFKLMRMLAEQSGNLLDIASISRDSGIPYVKVSAFINAFEMSGILILLRPFFKNRRTEVVKAPKLYFQDCGVRNSIRGSFDVDGPGFEGHILAELVKHGFPVRYWRTMSKAEVDFVVDVGPHLIAVEAKMGDPKPSRSLRSFMKKYAPSRAYVVTMRANEPRSDRGVIQVNPIDLIGQLDELKRSSGTAKSS